MQKKKDKTLKCYGNVCFTFGSFSVFRRLRKSVKRRLLTLSCLSVRPSICPRRTTRLQMYGFSWNWYLRFFLKYVEKIQVPLKYDKNNGWFTFWLIYRVIRKSLRDFRPLRYSSWDSHAEGGHVNRGRDTPSFCQTLQVLDMSTLGYAADVNPVIKCGHIEHL